MKENDRNVTGDEISRFEARVMSVGHGVLSDDEWRRLIDTLEATQREVAALRAELDAVSTASGRRMDGWQAAEQRALRAEAEVERMRAVVEAAIAETISEERAAISDPIQPRRYARKVAVDAFRAAQQETTDA